MSPKPRAFEPRRLLYALRENYRPLLAVLALALFGGALVGRLAVPARHVAHAATRIAREPHAVFARALADDVLERAARRAGVVLPLSELRARVEVGFAGRDRLTVRVRSAEHGEREEEGARARKLADALAETYVALANERVDQVSFESRQKRDSARAHARLESERSEHALHTALAREGTPELTRELASARSELAALEHEASAAELAASSELARVQALREARPRTQALAPPLALAAAQRELSSKLAEGGSPAELAALRTRIEALQAPRPLLARSTGPQEAESRALSVRARGLQLLVTQKRVELARLEAIAARVAPLSSMAERARAEQLELDAQAEGFRAAEPRSAVVQHAELSTVEQPGLRLFVSLLAPLVALFALGLFYVLHQLRSMRVREATEVAHWLAAPVLTSSAWPGRSAALESLIDELADPALAALGTTLLLPLTELERPLAATLMAKLNARAQRIYRSPTGSRITIAQDWQGELDSSRIARAASVADRVLWVVAADVHSGGTLASRRSLLPAGSRVAAVLVDTEPSAVRSVGSAQGFWQRRAPAGGQPELEPSAALP